MPEPLLHIPEGDHNPYVSVAWSRTPFEPFDDEPFHVGVKTTSAYDGVAVEWESEGATGTAELRQHDDTWSGEIGPMAGSCRYRFVGRGTDDRSDTSDWHRLEIAGWRPLRFDGLELASGAVVLTADDGQLRLSLAERSLTWSLEPVGSRRGGAREATLGEWFITVVGAGQVNLTNGPLRLELQAEVAIAASGVRAWRLHWTLDDEERLLGAGERFDSLDQRGRRPDMRVYEQYKGQGSRTYFPVPWIISTRGYGLAVDGAARNIFDLGATVADTATLTAPGVHASGRWYAGEPALLIEAYTAQLGPRQAIPMWGYGPWMSGNEWNSQSRVREVVERTIAEDIPASVMVIEAWADEATFYLWNDTEYEPVEGAEPVSHAGMRHGGRWPDPQGLTDWLHEQDVRLVLWQIPVLKDMAEDADMDTDHAQQTRDVKHAVDAGLTVMAGDEPYRNRGWWFPKSHIIDFSNPEAAEWWFRKRAYLVDEMGIDGFKTDGGEHLWGADVRVHDGATGDEAANRYPTGYLAAYHRFLAEHGDGDELIFSRAGFTGSQLLPAHWAGDEDSTWQAYRASLTAGLSAGLSGVAFWGWDIAGFSGPLPTAELYQRATAMATFCPIMQYHSEHNGHRRPLADRTPWNMAEQTHDESVLDVYRRYARLRMNLVPYLHGLGLEAVDSGVPLMRAMALAFPRDPVARALDDQYLLGADLLVAPVLDPEVEERRVYLPSGDWLDFWSGDPCPPGWRTVAAPVDTIPVFVRAGSVIPLWMPDDACELGARVGLPTDGAGRLVLMVTPGDGNQAIADPTTGARWQVEVRRDGEAVLLTAADAPDGTAVWIRGEGLDQHATVVAGVARSSIA